MKIITSKFTKIVALTLMIVILLSVTMPMASAWQPATSVPFTDVGNHWARHNIGWAYANNITTGTSATTFHPNRDVSRAEFVTFLHRVAGRPSVGGSNPFNDVRQGAWYVNPVTWAYTNNITSGTSATRFNPSRAITRQELATMLHRYIQSVRTDVVRADANVINGFHDRGQVSSWAMDSVNWAVVHNIIGRGGSINPLGNATRAETVTMLNRVVDTFNLPTPPRVYSPEQIRREVNAQFDNLLASFNGTTNIEWNRMVLNIIPTDEESLTSFTFPSAGIESNHPAIIAQANEITRGLNNDMDKARAIHRWVATNIYGDMDVLEKLEQGHPDYFYTRWDSSTDFLPAYHQAALWTLENRRSLCVGFTNLTVALLRASGLPALVVTADGHEWYATFVDGRWIMGDSMVDRTGDFVNGTFITKWVSYFQIFDSIEAGADFRIDYRFPMMIGILLTQGQ